MLTLGKTLLQAGILFIAASVLAGCPGVEKTADGNAFTETAGRASEGEVARTAASPDLQELTKANNRFAFDLYHELRSAEGRPLFFSPASIATALAMTWAGARGETEEEMAQALGLELGQERVHDAFAALLSTLNAPGQRAFELHVANRLWLQAGYRFLPQYLATTREHYAAEPVTLDFERQAEPSRRTINNWVEEQTAGRIRDLIPRDSLDTQTRLVLTNAVYFKGTWAKQFRKESTRPAPFHRSATEQVDVPMMQQSVTIPYTDAATLQVAMLPYEGGELSMVILVPKEIEGLAALEKELSAEAVDGWMRSTQPREVELHLPRFRVEAEFQLATTLADMGMRSAFASGAADFSGMDGTRLLYLSAVIHKAFVDVNEEGTEAAAATGIVVRPASAAPPPAVLRADRPFVFLIRHDPTGTILFIGRVTQP
jgi:serpin B